MPRRQDAAHFQLCRHLHEQADRPQQHDEHHDVGPDHAEQVFEQHQPHAALAPAQQIAGVAQHDLDAALGPAQALLPQALEGFGHQDEAQRARLVADVPMVHLQAPTDVDVLGDHVIGPVADPMQCGTTKRADHARDREQPSVHALRTLDHADDRGKLAHLQAAEQGGAVADARIAGHRAHARPRHQMPHHPVHGVLVEQGIAVDANQIFRTRRQRAHAHGVGLAKIAVEMDHAQPLVLRGQLVELLGGVVLAAVVDGDDFEIRIALRERGADGLAHLFTLVEAGDQD